MRLVALLGFQCVDIGLFLNSSADVKKFVAEPVKLSREICEQVELCHLEPADLFLIVGGDDFVEGALNSVNPVRRAEIREIFRLGVRAAQDIGLRGLSILPGVAWPDQPAAGWMTAVSELSFRVDVGAQLGIEVRIEPHIGSIVSTPELVLELLDEVPDLRLTFDPGHFVFQAIEADRMLPLVPLATHVHLSAAKPGAVHVAWRQNTVDFARIVTALEQSGFDGQYCVEYVPMSKWGADSTDVLAAITATRDAISDLLKL